MTAEIVALDVYSDVICPWCYIGKARLDNAIGELPPQLEVTVRWRAFELNPDMPVAGIRRDDYIRQKFGSAERSDAIYAQVKANALTDELPLALNKIEYTPNTRAAHQLIASCLDNKQQGQLVKALFAAYFVEGRDIGKRDVLSDISTTAGLSKQQINAALDGAEFASAVEQELASARALEIHGVPAFACNNRLLFSGAQASATITRVIERVQRKGLQHQ